MGAESWRGSIPSTDRNIHRAAGFGGSVGFGLRPAILVIDVQYRTTGDHSLPVDESIQAMSPLSCGENAWRAIPAIEQVLQTARRSRIPVFFPYVAPKQEEHVGRMGALNPAVLGIEAHGYEFVAEVAPVEGDILVPKRHPSAFFGTTLLSSLIDLKVDTLILLGATTSGCIRATATDAFSYNFHVIVVEEAVFDRVITSHNVGLFDVDSKYGDVVDLDRTLQYLEGQSTGE